MLPACAGAGYVAGFPNTYAEKVGKTSDAMYKGTRSVGPWLVHVIALILLYCSVLLGIYEQCVPILASKRGRLQVGLVSAQVHCSAIFPRCVVWRVFSSVL